MELNVSKRGEDRVIIQGRKLPLSKIEWLGDEDPNLDSRSQSPNKAIFITP